MTKYIAIFFGKFVVKFMNLFRFNATVFPGKVILTLFPKFLYKIKYPKLSIMVTGSSGKGSTTKMVQKVLEDNNISVTSNVGDSNLINAFATTIIDSCNLKCEIKTDAFVFEVDERFLKEITKYLKPNYLIINNLTRDQPPRQGSFDTVFDEIVKGINDDIHLIVNGDDPITRKFSLYHKGKITYFGIDRISTDRTSPINYTKDYLYCPKCSNKLDFEYFHFGSVGKYECKNCDFKRDNIKYEVNKIDNDYILINNNKININNTILFNIYNICAVYAICSEIGIDNKGIIESLNNYNMDNKIFNEFFANNRKYTVLNCKAENNATYNLSLLYTSIDKDEKVIVLGLKEISRRYKHFDISWIYDISFELLMDNNVNKIICVGPYRYDFASALKYLGFDNIILLETFSNIKDVINNNTKGNIYGILNFDYVKPFINAVKEDK